MNEFRTVVDTLNLLVPGMQIATDIICGFPGKISLKSKCSVVHIQEQVQERLQLGRDGRFKAYTTQPVYDP